jgi:hypothetical protein
MSTLNNRSRTHSPDVIPRSSSRIHSHKMSTDRKKEVDYISSKIDQYKKGIDKKIDDNIKTIIEDLKVKKEMTPSSSRKTIERTIDHSRTIDTSKLKTHSDINDTACQSKTSRKIGLSSGRKIESLKTMVNVTNVNSNFF